MSPNRERPCFRDPDYNASTNLKGAKRSRKNGLTRTDNSGDHPKSLFCLVERLDQVSKGRPCPNKGDRVIPTPLISTQADIYRSWQPGDRTLNTVVHILFLVYSKFVPWSMYSISGRYLYSNPVSTILPTSFWARLSNQTKRDLHTNQTLMRLSISHIIQCLHCSLSTLQPYVHGQSRLNSKDVKNVQTHSNVSVM